MWLAGTPQVDPHRRMLQRQGNAAESTGIEQAFLSLHASQHALSSLRGPVVARQCPSRYRVIHRTRHNIMGRFPAVLMPQALARRGTLGSAAHMCRKVVVGRSRNRRFRPARSICSGRDRFDLLHGPSRAQLADTRASTVSCPGGTTCLAPDASCCCPPAMTSRARRQTRLGSGHRDSAASRVVSAARALSCSTARCSVPTPTTRSLFRPSAGDARLSRTPAARDAKAWASRSLPCTPAPISASPAAGPP